MAVEKVPVEWSGKGVQLANLDEAYRFATAVAKSGLAGNARPEQILVQLQTGMELGMAPMESFNTIHVIKGRATIAVAQQAALVERNGGLTAGSKILVDFSGEEKSPDWTCSVTSLPKGAKDMVSSSVTWADFKHLTGDNWNKYPKRMLKARAVGYHIRDYYQAYIAPSVMHFTEEAEDMEELRDITPVADPKKPDPLLQLLPEGETTFGDPPEVVEAESKVVQSVPHDAASFDTETGEIDEEWVKGFEGE